MLWALRRLALVFLVFVARPGNGADAALPDSSARPAVERGLGFLRKEAFRWKTTRKCAACHHAPTMIWTFNEARAAGYSVDEPALQEVTTWAFLDMKTNSLAAEAPPRDVIHLGWVYVLLSAETAPGLGTSALLARESSSAIGRPRATREDDILSARQTLLQQMIKKQAPDGSWGRPLDERVPLGGPVEDIAILSRLALVQSGDASKRTHDCVDKAGTWLALHPHETSRQARNLRLLMNACEHRPAAELSPAIASLRAEQNSDGGWSQTPELASDAYATGQALYVLARGGVRPGAGEMKRGVQYLIRSQREDGSWPMKSRVNAKDLTPITSAGTAWAVLGLLRASH